MATLTNNDGTSPNDTRPIITFVTGNKKKLEEFRVLKEIYEAVDDLRKRFSITMESATAMLLDEGLRARKNLSEVE